jgi:glycosyltransferase involved in cell wall biosynthesis
MARICFFARVASPAVLERNGFYAQDLRALRELGHEVVIASRISQLRPADLYYVWWWTWAFVPAGFARLLGRPVVVSGVLQGRPFHSRPAAHRWLIRRTMAHVQANVFASRDELDGFGPRLGVRNASYLPLTVDTQRFRPAGERDPNLVFTLSWIEAANSRRKCLPEIIAAAARVCARRPEARFVIGGAHTAHVHTLRRLADASGFGDRIELPGVLTFEEKVALMQRCGAYLQPSRYEGFGLAIAEAMACGAPVVTSAVGEVPHVVGDAAVLVDGTDPEQIAAATLLVLDDAALREDLGRRGRARIVANFPYERRRDGLAMVIERVLGPQRVPLAPAVPLARHG